MDSSEKKVTLSRLSRQLQQAGHGLDEALSVVQHGEDYCLAVDDVRQSVELLEQYVLPALYDLIKQAKSVSCDYRKYGFEALYDERKKVLRLTFTDDKVEPVQALTLEYEYGTARNLSAELETAATYGDGRYASSGHHIYNTLDRNLLFYLSVVARGDGYYVRVEVTDGKTIVGLEWTPSVARGIANLIARLAAGSLKPDGDVHDASASDERSDT